MSAPVRLGDLRPTITRVVGRLAVTRHLIDALGGPDRWLCDEPPLSPTEKRLVLYALRLGGYTETHLYARLTSSEEAT